MIDGEEGGNMLKIGVIVGREWSWPPAFIEEVNKRDQDIVAEYPELGGTQMDEPCPYAVLVDRISHEVPYYRSYLKNAMLQGTYVINNPFMRSEEHTSELQSESNLVCRLLLEKK